MVNATGLGSGIDVNGLVTQLVTAERANADLQFTRATNKANTELSALGSLKSSLAGFQSTLASLNNLSSFDKKSGTSSDAATVAMVTREKAVPNNYSMEVSQLADSHSLASMSFAATDTAIGTGTLTFRYGTTVYDANTDTYSGFTLNPDSKVTTLTIDSSNNTLAGIMKAINDANFGVSASIINAGDGYKLLMSSNNTGLKNSLEVTTADGDANNTNTGASAGLSNFAFNSAATNMVQSSAAKDAQFKINGLSLTASDNVVKNAIDGVDLTLKKVTTAPLSLSIKKDNSLPLAAMQAFVSGYNSLARSLTTLSGYDATKKQGGPLMGDATLRSIMSQVSGVLRKAVDGLGGNITTLSSIGLKTNSDGQFVLDSTRFNEVLNTSPELMKPLFSAFGAPSDSNVKFKEVTTDTKVGNYAVAVTQMPTAGTFAGSGVLPAFTPGNYLTLDGNNNSFTIEVDGVNSGALSLTTGEYQSGSALAQEIQARINGAATLSGAGVAVTVSYDAGGNNFSIVSNSVGSTSTVKMKAVGTNTTAALGFAVQDGTAGVDVAGTIGGVAATGLGKVLTAADSSDAKGLKLTVEGGSTGSRGTINFTRGITNQIDLLLTKMLDAKSGLQSRIDGYTSQLKNIADQKDDKEIHWTVVKKRYLAQFNALDSLVAKLNSTGTFLTQQLASLPGVVQK